jgi:hypothetical protein
MKKLAGIFLSIAWTVTVLTWPHGEESSNWAFLNFLAAILPSLLGVGAQALGLGQPNQQLAQTGPATGDQFQRTRSQTVLPEATAEEQALAGAAQQAATSAFQGARGGAIGGAPSLAALSAGQLPGASRSRIQDLAFGGLEEALSRASRVAGEQALSRGVPLSSMEFTNAAELQRPLLSEATRNFAALSQQELGRLGDLRQTAFANTMAVQESPALQRLTGLRMAQGQQQQDALNLQRGPGGLPYWAVSGGSPTTGIGDEKQYRLKTLEEQLRAAHEELQAMERNGISYKDRTPARIRATMIEQQLEAARREAGIEAAAPAPVADNFFNRKLGRV